MASKPTVTLTLAGDEKKLTESFSRTETAGDSMVKSISDDQSKLSSAFDKVGTASKSMSDKVSSSSKDMADTGGSGFDSVTESVDGAEGKFMGFHDVLDGVKGGLETLSDPSASLTDKMIGLGQAGADIAGGMASFLLPMLGSLWTKLTATTAATTALSAAQTVWNGLTAAGAVVMKLLNAAFVSSPIGWIVLLIGGLITAFVLLWNKSAAFRDFFIGMWNAIKTAFGAVVDWVKSVWNGIPGFFGGIADAIKGVFNGIGDAIKNVFKGAVNGIITVLNGIITGINFLIRGINAVNPFDDIPSIPKIPKLHSGGIVPGMPGEEQLMVLQGGEKVSTSSQGGGGAATVEFRGDLDSGLARWFMKAVNNGDIRIVV